MIKLIDILKEIGDASSQPYHFDFYGNNDDYDRYYGFETESYPYSVHIIQDEESNNEIGISFFIPDEDDPNIDSYVETNKDSLFKIMATVVAIVKQDLKNHPEVDTLVFSPVQKQKEIDTNTRSNLYLRYIKYAYPNATVKNVGKDVVVKIK